MTIELPLFRLGLAGFSPEHASVIADALDDNPSTSTVWEIGEFQDADAWWVNGARTQSVGGGRIRVAAGRPSDRSPQLQLADVDRPLAFGQPLPAGMEALLSFAVGDRDSMHAALRHFEGLLAPVRALFFLAAHILEHESVLGRGVFDITSNGGVLAVVDMQSVAGVDPRATPADFESARWVRRQEATPAPDTFVRATISQLMWQYARRTQRDVLPRRYRAGLLYYRRPPKLPQRLLTDAHLMLMRELLSAPATFRELEARCGIDELTLARELAALYYVGSITANAKRAASARLPGETTLQGPMSGLLPSGMQSVGPDTSRGRLHPFDRTVPAQMDGGLDSGAPD